MIVCPACSHRNPERARLCEQCGRSLAGFVYRACPSCGALNAARNAFCHRCFAELAPAEGTPPIPESTLVRPYAPPTPLGEEEAEVIAPPRVERTPGPAGKAERVPAQAAAAQPTEAQAPAAEPIAPPAEARETPPTLAPEAAAPPSAEAKVTAEEEVSAEAGAEAVAAPAAEQPEALPAEALGSPLEGVEEALPLAEGVALPHRAAPEAARGVGAAEEYEGELFQQVAVERAPLKEAAQVVLVPKGRGLPRLGRAALYLLVILAALVPLATGGQSGAFVQPREEVAALSREIGALPAGSEVLLSFDYSPTYAGEVDALALAVVRHLAKKHVRMVAMSTRPEGVGLAQQVFQALTQENAGTRYGEDYVLLGYLPAEEAGLRTLNSSLADAFKVDQVEHKALGELAATAGLISVKDLDRVILLADDGQAVRRWVEQVGTPSEVTLDVLATSGIEPLLVPYRQSGQLRSLIAGAAGAAEYEVAAGVKANALTQADAYGALFLVLVVVAIATNVVYISRGEREKEVT